MDVNIEKIFAELGRLHIQVMALQEELQQLQQENAKLKAELEKKNA